MGTMTILYDNNKNTVISGVFNPYYMVDGKRPILENGIYELDYVTEIVPNYNIDTEKIEISFEVDLVRNLYIKKSNIIPKSNYEIAIEDWIHLDYSKRVVVPYSYLYSIETNTIVNAWIVKNLPIKYDKELIYLYDNDFDANTLTFIDKYTLEVQNIPSE